MCELIRYNSIFFLGMEAINEMIIYIHMELLIRNVASCLDVYEKFHRQNSKSQQVASPHCAGSR